MIMTDNRKTIKIELRTWRETHFSPDFSNDFFDDAAYNEKKGVYEVPDVDYCIKTAAESDPDTTVNWEEIDLEEYMKENGFTDN